MARTRTFIAVAISPDVIAKIEELVRELAEGIEGVKWVAPEHLHFTLKFLGDVQDNDLHEVCAAVAGATQSREPFEVLVAGAGAFPNVRRPRTIWVGAGKGGDEFEDLHAVVDKALRKLGFRSESRRFTPHITVGRIRQGNPTLSRLTERLQAHAATEMAWLSVDEALVFSSELRPEGPEYNVLGRAALGQ